MASRRTRRRGNTGARTLGGWEFYVDRAARMLPRLARFIAPWHHSERAEGAMRIKSCASRLTNQVARILASIHAGTTQRHGTQYKVSLADSAPRSPAKRDATDVSRPPARQDSSAPTRIIHRARARNSINRTHRIRLSKVNGARGFRGRNRGGTPRAHRIRPGCAMLDK